MSLNSLSAAIVDEDVGLTDPGSVETRVWRPSLPVVHLAAAAGIVAQNAPQDHLCRSLPEAFLTNRWWVESVVQLGEETASLISRVPRLRVVPSQLIRVRLA